MPAKNTRRSWRSQGRRFLTFEEATEHHAVKKAVGDKRKEWRERREERLRPYKSNPKVATDPKVYANAVEAELKTQDVEPSSQTLVTSKLRDGTLPLFVRDAVGNLVKGNRADLEKLIGRGKRDDVLIYENDLQKACRGTKRGTRGPPPEKRDRVVKDMMRDLEDGRYTIDQFRDRTSWTYVALGKQYDCDRRIAKNALELVLSQFKTLTNCDTV